mmetsp:Transcript_23072/g.55252  ORF Transcript_23072/g.55252 Transcript_23072/m.55252 type:complete len:216 (+) Transcript_23072:202-849(+)
MAQLPRLNWRTGVIHTLHLVLLVDAIVAHHAVDAVGEADPPPHELEVNLIGANASHRLVVSAEAGTAGSVGRRCAGGVRLGWPGAASGGGGGHVGGGGCGGCGRSPRLERRGGSRDGSAPPGQHLKKWAELSTTIGAAWRAPDVGGGQGDTPPARAIFIGESIAHCRVAAPLPGCLLCRRWRGCGAASRLERRDGSRGGSAPPARYLKLEPHRKL